MLRYVIASTVISASLLIGTAEAAFGQAASSQPKSVASVKTSAVQANKAYVRSTVERLNVRTAPRLTATVIQMIGKSGSYEVLDKQDKWLKIQLAAQKTGWVSADYMEQASAVIASSAGKPDAKPAAEATTPVSGVVKIIDVTNLRKGPGIDKDIVGKAKPGDTYPILGKEGEWYRISFGKGTAYVAAWVVTTDTSTGGKAEASVNNQQIYIYHTHNRESWKTDATQTKGVSIDDPKINITLVGERLGAALEKKGISTIVSQVDIAERLAEKKLGYSQSYAESRKAVQAAMKANKSLGFFFDIHRDSDVPRAQTTVTLGGKTYARVLFVIGKGNANYKANKQLADALHQRLEKAYPGLSRGVLLKDAEQGDGEYNQSLSPRSLLLEIGGANNTLQESLNTADAFAIIFAAYYGASK